MKQRRLRSGWRSPRWRAMNRAMRWSLRNVSQATHTGNLRCVPCSPRAAMCSPSPQHRGISPALTMLGSQFLDLNRARRIASSPTLDMLPRALALEALDASTPFSNRPSHRATDEQWWHWAAAGYHLRKSSPEHADLAHLRLVPLLIATEFGSLKRKAAARLFILEMFRVADRPLRRIIWQDMEVCREVLGIEAASVYPALLRRPSVLGRLHRKMAQLVLMGATRMRH